MEENAPIQNITLEYDFTNIKLSGKRDINSFIDDWLSIRNNLSGSTKNILINDTMAGEISQEGICLLLEVLSEYNFYNNKKIAIILNDTNSYNTRFFDVFAKHWGMNIKHFINEKEAVCYLIKQS